MASTSNHLGDLWKAAALAILILLSASSFVVISAMAQTSSESSTQSSTQTSNGYLITQQWVDQHIQEWTPTSVYPMDFGAPLLTISYANIYFPWDTPPVVNADLAMLEQSGMNMVRIDMGFDAWLANDTATINSFDNYVQMINASGKLLVIADASAERYRSYPLTWSQFQYAWLQRVYTLAARYHPYAYIVVKEPGWYYPMISDASTNPAVYDPNSWGNLTAALVQVVKSVSPNTKVGVAVAATDLYNDSAYQGRVSFTAQYLQNVERIPGLDFIAFDIYDIPGFQGTQRFLSQVGTGGKAVWIAEAWSGDGSFVTDSSRSSLDASWMLALYYFALKIHAQAMLPFYSDIFASYGTPPETAPALLQFFQNRTSVFYEFKEIISSNAADELPPNVISTTTSTSTQSTSTQSTSTQSTSTGGNSSSGTAVAPESRPSSGTSGAVAVIVGVAAAAGVALIVYGTSRRRRR